MHSKTVTIVFLVFVISTTVLAKGIPCEMKDLHNSEFTVSKSSLNSDDDIKQRVTEGLGKVSDNVKAFSEKILLVAKTLIRDWILRNDDGSDAQETESE